MPRLVAATAAGPAPLSTGKWVRSSASPAALKPGAATPMGSVHVVNLASRSEGRNPVPAKARIRLAGAVARPVRHSSPDHPRRHTTLNPVFPPAPEML